MYYVPDVVKDIKNVLIYIALIYSANALRRKKLYEICKEKNSNIYTIFTGD